MKANWRRSRSDKMLGGVCGGLASYLGIGVTLIRVFFSAAAVVSGLGVALYLVLWLITPPQGAGEGTTRDEAARLAMEEIEAQARQLGEEAQSAMDSDDPQIRMIVRWSLALLIGLALNRARPRRRMHHHARSPHKPPHAAKPGQPAEAQCCEPSPEPTVEAEEAA